MGPDSCESSRTRPSGRRQQPHALAEHGETKDHGCYLGEQPQHDWSLVQRDAVMTLLAVALRQAVGGQGVVVVLWVLAALRRLLVTSRPHTPRRLIINQRR